MRAVVFDNYGPIEEVVDISEDFPRPYIDRDSSDVLVKVHAASLTQKDLKIVLGHYKSVEPVASFPRVLGGDVSGVVEAVGDRCRKFRPGDEVIGIVSCGSMAEYVKAPEVQWIRKPKKTSHLHAAAFPYSGVLAFQCLYMHGKLKEGEKVLILNGSGGVGSLAVQMAIYKKAKVYATASDNLNRLRELGVQNLIDYTKCQWHQQLEGEDIDLILDLGVGYSAWAHCMKVLHPQNGRLVSLVPDTPDGPIEFFNYKFGIPLREFRNRNRYRFVKEIDLSNTNHLAYIAKMVEQGYLKPMLDPNAPFEFNNNSIQAMLKGLQSKHTVGKLIVNIANSSPQH